MSNRGIEIEEQAIGWHIRLRAAGPAEWEAFTAWLEADPAHLAAYEEAALADAELDELRPPAPTEPRFEPNPAPRRWMSRRTVLGGAIAAAIVGMVGYGALAPDGSPYAVETAAGQRRSIALADGSRIDLNGATRIVLDRENVRFARLEQGEALFTIVHDEARPFEVEAGDARLQDLGTVFNVVRDGGLLEVGVAEGAVRFNPDAEALDLRPGMALSREPGGAPRISRREPEAVTGWRRGRLTYASANVRRVASDLSRNLGVPVQAGRDVAARPFTGVIMLDRDPQRSVDRAAALMGVGVRRSGAGWILQTGAGETR